LIDIDGVSNRKDAMESQASIIITGREQLLVESLAAALSLSQAIITPVPYGACLECPAMSEGAILIVVNADPVELAPIVRAFRNQCPEGRIIVTGEDLEDEVVVRLFESGVTAWISMMRPLNELLRVIEPVRKGETHCSRRVTGFALTRIASFARERGADLPANLTQREKEVLELVGAGFSNKQIAQQLSISVHTAKNHVHNMLEKLSLRRRREAIRWMARLPEPVLSRRGRLQESICPSSIRRTN